MSMHLSSIEAWRGEEDYVSIRVSTRALELMLIFDDETTDERIGEQFSLGTGSLSDVAAALDEMAARLRRMAQRREAREEEP